MTGPLIAPQLSVRNGQRAVEFYSAAFGAVEIYRGGDTSVVSVVTRLVAEAEEGHGRIADPFGHHWQIGRPPIPWPPR